MTPPAPSGSAAGGGVAAPPGAGRPGRELHPRAFLVILPDGRAPGAIRPDLAVAGLPLLRRIALAAGRAGFAHVLVGGAEAAADPLLAGTGAVALGGAPHAPGEAGRVVLLSAHAIPQVDWLRRLRTMELPPGRLLVDGAVVGALDTADAGRVIGEAARLGRIDAALAALRGRLEAVEAGGDAGGRFVLEGPGDVDRAERWMLRRLVKDNEGFMSRHVERRLSLLATRRLAHTAITPNAVTLVSLAIGFCAAPCFLSPRPAWQLAGALAFLLHSILDGCDGELARLKYLQSRFGAVLDFWGDNLVHVAVFGSMAVGWSRAAGSAWPLAVGAVAVLGTLAAAAALHRRQTVPGSEGPERPATGRMVDHLAHRDFIYLILALAWWGRAWWFLAPAAAGIPLFLLALAWPDGRARAER